MFGICVCQFVCVYVLYCLPLSPSHSPLSHTPSINPTNNEQHQRTKTKVFDPSLAPPGKAVVHAYTAGNEPYALWEGLERGGAAYNALKRERTQVLWAALERVIPDVRARSELVLEGTPLTHERYLRRHRGTYGAAISAAPGSGFVWPGAATPLPGLSVCGDSTMPGESCALVLSVFVARVS